MQSLAALLASRWTLSLLGTAFIAVLFWFYAPLLPAFEGWLPRLALIGLLLSLWLAANALLEIRRQRRDAALTQGIVSAKGQAETEEAQALRARLTEALKQLKTSLGRRTYLNELPWYAIIGPPGAGKTTALLNAGLRFPLAETMGQAAVHGVGGTRLCDWWFTDRAVLIDTAGRYTTQDSNAAVDRAGWETFLDLLKQTRPRQPLNGLLVAYPLDELLRAPAQAVASTIRTRIGELQARLGVRIPVYVLFTKADLIAGFTEFFDDLDREKRAQVWGVTFDPAGGKDDPAASFGRALRDLVERLNARLFDRLQAERASDRRARIMMFPGQVANLEPLLAAFVRPAFGASRDQPPLWLRGVYFTSGTQEGTPLDRLTGTLARALGVDQAAARSLQPVRGRSYFLERLLKDVIFNEATLVAHDPAAMRRRAILRTAGFAVAALLVVLTAGTLWRMHSIARREIDTAAAALATYEQTAHGLPLDPVADDDLAGLAPLLDQARALTKGGAEPEWLPGGLSQRDKLQAAARAVYRHALEWALLPRLMWRLEAQLRGNLDRPDFLYEATRVYLMLGNAGPLDPSLVRAWMELDWQTAYPGLGYAPLRERLMSHLDALLAEPLPQVQLDGGLVTAVRARIASVPMPQRVYARIRPSPAARALPAWRPGDALGPVGIPLFVRASGKSLMDGIPGFFTVDGFHKVLLPSLDSAAASVASETWVLGEPIAFDRGGARMQALEQAVIKLYEADYAQVWDQMLADLNVVPSRSLSQAAQDLYVLASPESPLRRLLVSIGQQLTLSAASADSQAAPSQPPGHEIDDRYQALRGLVGTGPGAPIDGVLRSLGDAQQQIAKLAATLVGSGAVASTSGAIDPLVLLKADAARQPEPLGRWLTQIADNAVALRSGDPRQQLAAIFNASGGPADLCAAVVNNHYPFVPVAPDDAPVTDFARLFAPGGALDGFMNTLLRRYVDTSTKPWRLIAPAGGAAPISAADLAQFQRAATIRDTFFAGSGSLPMIRLDITPVSADAGARQVLLDLDGTQVVYQRGARQSAQLTWPAFEPRPAARLSFDPAPASGPDALREAGPWALFRLFGHGRLTPQTGSDDRYQLAFQLGERRADFDVRIPSGLNPFLPGLLQDFRCPAVKGN